MGFFAFAMIVILFNTWVGEGDDPGAAGVLVKVKGAVLGLGGKVGDDVAEEKLLLGGHVFCFEKKK
jgi:hypothetical protein